jgi:hypothetical protein
LVNAVEQKNDGDNNANARPLLLSNRQNVNPTSDLRECTSSSSNKKLASSKAAGSKSKSKSHKKHHSSSKKSAADDDDTNKNRHLIEMVKDMASFKWPDLEAATSSKNITSSEQQQHHHIHQQEQPQQQQQQQAQAASVPKQLPIQQNMQFKEAKQMQNQFDSIEQQQQQQTTTTTTESISRKETNGGESRYSRIITETLKSYSMEKKSSRSPSCARSYSGDHATIGRFRSVTKMGGSSGVAGGGERGLSNAASFISSRAASTSTAASRSSSRSSSVKIVNILGKEIVKLPSFLEREIKIKKNFVPLGLTRVDCAVDEGVNGCCVLKVDSNSACARDGRLKSGDFLLSVNNEQMRNLTNSSAKAILTRASLTSNDVV